MKRKSLIWLAVTVALSAGAVANSEELVDTTELQVSAPIKLAVAAQPIAAALNEFARQSGLHVVIGSEVAAGVKSTPLEGTFTREAALDRLLSDTGLRYEYLDAQTVAVLGKDRPRAAVDGGSTLRLAQVDSSSSFPSPGDSQGEGAQRATEEAKVDPPSSKDNGGSRIEEIVVTAQKREESIKDVPQAITALSGEELGRRNITDTQSLALQVPGLNVQVTGGGQLDISIRGIQSYRGRSNLTGLYLDDAPASGLQDGYSAGYVDMAPIDLARVEVLKGPQGTLFGEGAVGGVVRYITNSPDLSRLGGSAKLTSYATRGGDPSSEAVGLLNVPVVEDTFGVRIAGSYKALGGWIENVSTGEKNFNDERIWDLRVKPRLKVGPNLTIDGLVYLHHARGDGTNIANFGPPGNGEFISPYDPNFPTNYKNDFEIYNITATYDLGFASILSSTSHMNTDGVFQYAQYVVGSPPPGSAEVLFEANIINFSRQGTITAQEVRLSSNGNTASKWVVGGSFKDQRLDKSFGDGFFLKQFYGTVNRPAIQAGLLQVTESRSWAGFGDASYTFFDRLEIGGGLRYFTERRRESVPNLAGDTPYSGTFNALTYRAFARLLITDDVNVYVNTGTGFRSGGFNTSIKVVQGAPPFIGNEKSRFYEAGLKSTFLDGKAGFDIAVFQGIFFDQQQDLTMTGLDGLPLGYTGNVGNAKIRGVEWLSTLRPTRQLRASFSGTVMDTRYIEVSPTAPYFVGDPISYVPKYDLQFSGGYSFDWASEVPGSIDVSLTQRGKQYGIWRGLAIGRNFEVSKPLTFLQVQINARVQGFDVGIFGRNLLNERDQLAPNVTGAYSQARSMQLGLTIGKTF